jgi:hypothetical protein
MQNPRGAGREKMAAADPNEEFMPKVEQLSNPLVH